MSIRPIDLQNLFARLNEVGKQQSDVTEANAHAQHVAGSEIAQKASSRNSKVGESETLPEGPEKSKEVADEEGDRQARQEQDRKSGGEDRAEDDIFRDPDLGTRVDIST